MLSPLIYDSNGNCEPDDWSKAISIVLEKMSNAKILQVRFRIYILLSLLSWWSKSLTRDTKNPRVRVVLEIWIKTDKLCTQITDR